MALDQTALQGVLASATSVTYLECLTITHSAITTLRLVNDKQDLVRTAGTYVRFPFKVTAPEQETGTPPRLQITCDIVDQRVVQAVRLLAGKRERAKIVYDVVRADAPDSIQWGPVEFEFSSASTSGLSTMTIDATFMLGALNDAFPHRLFSPSNAG